MTCSPRGDLAAPTLHPAVCHCGMQVWPVPAGDDWAWQDNDGRTRVDNVAAVLAEERRIREEIVTINDTPAWNRYSVMQAQLGLMYIDLGHSHTPTTTSPYPPPPWCCSQPMQAIPTGWRCRDARTTHPYRTT